MLNFDYQKEPLRDILFLDVKSFYATVECAARDLDPLTTMLVVMSTTDNTGKGLILASSPMAKAKLGISNVTRANHLPNHPDLLQVTPRMNLYIQENKKFNALLKEYVAAEDHLVYSIDESLIDVTDSMKLFFPDSGLSRSEKRRRFAQRIQQEAKEKLGLVLSVGIGDNPLLAKLALDNGAKHSPIFQAQWRYGDIPETVWRIPHMQDFWGIGSSMEKNFYRLGIDSIYQLAHTDSELLYQKFGIMGQQHYYHANGIDRTRLAEAAPIAKEKSYGNSQVLPKNYTQAREIEIVLGEMAEQVAARIRRHGCLTQCVSLFIGGAMGEKNGFSHQMKIPATDNTKKLKAYCLFLFRKYYKGQVVRHIGVSYSRLLFTQSRQLSLFQSPEENEAEEHLDQVIDRIREKYGFTAIIHATSKLAGARSIARSHLVAGHNGGAQGGLDGL